MEHTEKISNQIMEHVQTQKAIIDTVVEIGMVATPEYSVNITDKRHESIDLKQTNKLSDSVIRQNVINHEGCSVTESSEDLNEQQSSESNEQQSSESAAQDLQFKSKVETATDQLVSGLLTTLLPEQEKLKKQLSDIIQSQCVLIETIEHENSEFREKLIIKEVTDIMDRARIYQTKLVNVKKEMMSLHEKMSQLKRRALKLQQQKQREALHREHQRDVELEKEKQLMAKVILRKT